ncbi:hypothetical protein D3C71_938860 [compost metagenome]
MAFLVFQPQRKTLHATIADGKIGAQVADQTPQWEQQRGMHFHFVTQLQSRVEMVRRRVAGQRIIGLAVELADVIQHLATKAATHTVAGQSAQCRQRANTHAMQALTGITGQGRAPHRHLVQHRLHLRGLRHHHAIAQAHQHPRRTRCRRQRDAMTEAQCFQFAAQAPFKARPRPEQLKAGLHFQHDRVRPLLADQRAVTVRPRRQKPMPMRLGLGVVVQRAYLRQQGMRGGQAHAGRQSILGSAVVDRVQTTQLRRPFDQRQGLVRIRQTPEDGVQRQLRQQNAGPEHDRSLHQAQRLRGNLPAAAFAHLPGIVRRQVFQPQRRR